MNAPWRRFDGTPWRGPITEPPLVQSCPAIYDGQGKAWYHCLLEIGHNGAHRGSKGRKLTWWGTGAESVLA